MGETIARRGSHGEALLASCAETVQIANRFGPTTIDEFPIRPRTFLINVDETLKELLDREDTDKNMQITIEDVGPKVTSNTCVTSFDKTLSGY